MGTWFHVEKQLLVMSFRIKFMLQSFCPTGKRSDLKGMANSAVQLAAWILVCEYHFASHSNEASFTCTIPSICASAALTPKVYPEVFLSEGSNTTETPSL